MGADCISVDGFECAGHPGENTVGNLVLLAKAARTLKGPFICSGGVGTGAQLAAALALGAEGVSMGTRFMATVEAPIHDGIKKALVDGDENSTELVRGTASTTTTPSRSASSTPRRGGSASRASACGPRPLSTISTTWPTPSNSGRTCKSSEAEKYAARAGYRTVHISCIEVSKVLGLLL